MRSILKELALSVISGCPFDDTMKSRLFVLESGLQEPEQVVATNKVYTEPPHGPLQCVSGGAMPRHLRARARARASHESMRVVCATCAVQAAKCDCWHGPSVPLQPAAKRATVGVHAGLLH